MKATYNPAFLLNLTHRNALRWHKTLIARAILTGRWLSLPRLARECYRDRVQIIRMMQAAWDDTIRQEQWGPMGEDHTANAVVASRPRSYMPARVPWNLE